MKRARVAAVTLAWLIWFSLGGTLIQPATAAQLVFGPVAPRFAAYYNGHDGLRVLGHAISTTVGGGFAQYFEKGRIEDHTGQPGILPSFQFQYGLLVDELHNRQFNLPIGGDTSTLNYAQLHILADPRLRIAVPRGFTNGQPFQNSDGSFFIPFTTDLSGAPGHNVPAYFYNFINHPDLFPAGWLHDIGLPISEVQSIQVTKASSKRQISVQAFQRTILTYDPANPASYQVERANVGTDYALGFPYRVPLFTNTVQPTPVPANPTPVPTNPAPGMANFHNPITVGPGGTLQVPSLGYGMDGQFIDDGNLIHDLSLLQTAQFDWIKQQFAWKDIEPVKGGQPNWKPIDDLVAICNTKNIKIIARVDTAPAWAATYGEPGLDDAPPNNPQDFADFLTKFASRYKGTSIVAYEIWNEPNLWYEWGGHGKVSPAAYVRLLKVSYQAIKAVDPQLMVLTAGLTPTGVGLPTALPDDTYLAGIYAAGGKPYFDAVSAHPEPYNHAPEAAIGSDPAHAHPSFYFRRAEQLRAIMVQNGDANKQMWLTEFGYTTDTVNSAYSWFAVNEATKAVYLAQAFAYAKTNWKWVGVMALWNLNFAEVTGANDEKAFWGVLNSDGSPRLSYNAIRDMKK